MELSHSWPEKKCYICGKTFIAMDDYIFKRSVRTGSYRYFCSWSHLREYDAQVKAKKGRKQNPKVAEIYRLAKEGFSCPEIAEKLGVKVTTVRYWMERRD